MAQTGRAPGDAPGWSLLVGSLLFSGTLYAMALGAPRWLGAVTPLGGLALMAGWLLLARAAWHTPESASSSDADRADS